nr:MAG TPA: hypothetical protein [Bacteriophage sp.]
MQGVFLCPFLESVGAEPAKGTIIRLSAVLIMPKSAGCEHHP